MNTISRLEYEWSQDGGFLGLLRTGKFCDDGLTRLLSILKKENFPDTEQIDKRIVALTWYIPTFMRWQSERLQENGVAISKLEFAISAIESSLEDVLGLP